MKIARLLFIFSLLNVGPALAHEFWIEPEKYQVESGSPLIASLKNGQKFEGISQAWFRKRFTRFEVIHGDDVSPVQGRMGDIPALQTNAPGNGLVIMVHETTASTLTYNTWAKFLAFVKHKDFTDAVETHEANDWPKERFRETYTRHVKSLVAVGDGAGTDRAIGLETEFIALSNPYARDFNGEIRVQLNYQGMPRVNAQVEVFSRRPDGTVAITLHRTDAKGQANVPVIAGNQYLFDAVVMRPIEHAGTEDRAPIWQSLWAALTFAVPVR